MAQFATQRTVDSCRHQLGECGSQRNAVHTECTALRANAERKGNQKRKLRIKSRTAAATPKPAVEAQQSGWAMAGRWISSIESEAMLAIPEEMSPCDLDLDLAIAAIHSLPDMSIGNGSDGSLCTPGLAARQSVASHCRDRAHGSTAFDNGPLPHVNLPHLPDIQNHVQARSKADAAANHSWAHHPSSNPHSYQALPSQWVQAHSQPRNQQSFPRQPPHHPFKRTATQISHGGAGIDSLAQPPPHLAQHPLSTLPAQHNASAHRTNLASEAAGAPGLSSQQQAVALERLQRLSAELQSAHERNARNSAAHAQALEEERLRHKEEVQRLRDSQQALRSELQSERSATANLRQKLEEAKQQRDSEAQAGAESATLLKAMELRIGIQAPPELLTGRQEFLQQADIAQKIWGQFESSASAAGVNSGSSKAPHAGSNDLDTAAKFDEAAHGVYKGLLATVMLLNSAAHQFQHGVDDASKRRGDIVGGRARIREAQEKLRKVGGLVSRLSEANALLASSGGTIERDAEYARRAVFVQAASVCQRRLITIGEHEYLSYERISVQQTRQHANAKHIEFVRLRDSLKQLSPASDTSCADVAAISPRAHARSGGGSGAGLNDATQTLLDLGHGFHAAHKRLELSVDSALKVTQEAPRLREDLLRLFNALGRVGSDDVVSKGRSIAWAMAAITGEFGCNVSQNVGTLQFAVETLKSLLSSDGAPKAKGTKRKVCA